MRRDWVSIVGVWLCLSIVPACSPLLRQSSADFSSVPATKVNNGAGLSPAATGSAACEVPRTADSSLKPVVNNEILQPVRPAVQTPGAELIPEPRNPAEASTAVKPAAVSEGDTQAASLADTHTKPAEEPPLLQALRCYLDNRPAEALSALRRYDRSSQEFLLCLLPLAVRLTEGDWEHLDAREANAMADRLDNLADHVASRVRPHADLGIKTMCFCSAIEGYGKYKPIPDGGGFRPHDYALIYVEFRNLTDQRQGSTCAIHLRSKFIIRDFSGRPIFRKEFPDPGPDLSHSERHDFYNVYYFLVPYGKDELAPGLYTLELEVTDVPTGRKVSHTLDFRVTAAAGKREW